MRTFGKPLLLVLLDGLLRRSADDDDDDEEVNEAMEKREATPLLLLEVLADADEVEAEAGGVPGRYASPDPNAAYMDVARSAIL